MRLPYPHELDTIPVTIKVAGEMSDEGEDATAVEYVGKCCFNESSKTKRDADGKLVSLIGKVFVGCDIAPSVKQISGVVLINEVEYTIYKSARPRNPDGSVHHTELELI